MAENDSTVRYMELHNEAYNKYQERLAELYDSYDKWLQEAFTRRALAIHRVYGQFDKEILVEREKYMSLIHDEGHDYTNAINEITKSYQKEGNYVPVPDKH